jgi:hypothetical protein
MLLVAVVRNPEPLLQGDLPVIANDGSEMIEVGEVWQAGKDTLFRHMAGWHISPARNNQSIVLCSVCATASSFLPR